MLASSRNHTPLVELLLDRNADKDAQDSDGDTALMSAATFGHDRVVRVLLWAGAKTGLKGATGQSALQLAKENGHTECARMIRDHKKLRRLEDTNSTADSPQTVRAADEGKVVATPPQATESARAPAPLPAPAPPATAPERVATPTAAVLAPVPGPAAAPPATVGVRLSSEQPWWWQFLSFGCACSRRGA